MRTGGEMGMSIREISHDEYLAELQNEIQTDGLIVSVRKRLDEINYAATGLSYADCMMVREKSAEIMDVLKAQEPLMVEERADTDTINCPKCGQQFARVGRDKSVYLDLDEEPDYCWKCGQAVKWVD